MFVIWADLTLILEGTLPHLYDQIDSTQANGCLEIYTELTCMQVNRF